MEKLDINHHLEIIRNKGNCHFTIRKAKKSLSLLKGVLSSKDFLNISIALSHVEIGEGADELNDVLKKINMPS